MSEKLCVRHLYLARNATNIVGPEACDVLLPHEPELPGELLTGQLLVPLAQDEQLELGS